MPFISEYLCHECSIPRSEERQHEEMKDLRHEFGFCVATLGIALESNSCVRGLTLLTVCLCIGMN